MSTELEMYINLTVILSLRVPIFFEKETDLKIKGPLQTKWVAKILLRSRFSS